MHLPTTSCRECDGDVNVGGKGIVEGAVVLGARYRTRFSIRHPAIETRGRAPAFTFGAAGTDCPGYQKMIVCGVR